MSKLLVTGGVGYVGSHLVHYLVKEKNISPANILVFDKSAREHSNILPDGVTVFAGDLRNFKDISRVFIDYEIDGVIHLAGMLNVAESMKQPGDYFDNNVVGGLNLLRAMASSVCRVIVFSSSCTVYGNALSPVSEGATCLPISPYGESKLQFEKMLEWYGRAHGFKAISLRYFNAAGAFYGIGEAHVPEIHLIPSILSSLVSGQEFVVYGNDYSTSDGTCVRDYVHVRDLASAHAKSLEYLQTASPGLEVFNLGSGQGVSVREVVGIAERVTGLHVDLHYSPRRPGDAEKMIADSKKANEILRWHPLHTIENCIEDAWEWLKKQKGLDSEQRG